MNSAMIINNLKQKNVLFLMIPLVLLLFMVGAIIYIDFLPTSPTNKTPKGSKVMSKAVEIKAVSPTENAMNIGVSAPISVTFTQPISEHDRNTIHFSFGPNIPGQEQWTPDNKTIVFSPSGLFNNNQEYTVTLVYEDKNYVWRFTTLPFKQESPEEQAKLQEKADANFREWDAMVTRNYPWLDKLPLQTDRYFFYFDIDKKLFIGKLYPLTTEDAPINTQVSTMKNDIMTQLTDLEIPTTQFQIEWQVTPETPQEPHE